MILNIYSLWAGSLTVFPWKTARAQYNRQLKQERRRRLRKRHLKSEFALLQTLSRYSISFSSSNVGDFFRSWILKEYIEVQEKKKKSLCSRPPENVTLSLSSLRKLPNWDFKIQGRHGNENVA